MLKNPPVCYFASFSIVSVTHFINKLDSLRDLTIFIISFISSFEIINIVILIPGIFYVFLVSATDAAAVNPNRIKMHLANGLSTFFIKGKPVFRSLPRNPPDAF